MEMSDFVLARADDCIIMIGEVVYKISFIDQMCYKMYAQLDSEEAKVFKIELEEKFDEWKKNTVEEFMESYPEQYKWHLEDYDWDGLMGKLTDIYKEEKYKND